MKTTTTQHAITILTVALIAIFVYVSYTFVPNMPY